VTVNLQLNAGDTEADDLGAVRVTLADGTTVVTANADGSYTIPAGQTQLLVTVPTEQNTTYEGDEAFSLTVSGGEGSVGSDTGSAVIVDLADLPKVSSVVGDSVTEGQSNTFTVTLSNDSTTATSVSLTLAGDSATKNVDFEGQSVTVVIAGKEQTVAVAADGTFSVSLPAGETSFQVKVATTNDSALESSEQYTLRAEANAVGKTGTATIVDNDMAVSVASGLVDEDGLAGGNAQLPADADAGPVSVSKSLVVTDGDGNAVSGAHLTLTTISGPLQLQTAAGEPVDIVSDGNGGFRGVAGNETVFTLTVDNTTSPASYSFTLLQPVNHGVDGDASQVSSQDALSFEIGYTVTADGHEQASGSFEVTVRDDVPTMTTADAVAVTQQSIPVVLNGTVDFTGANGNFSTLEVSGVKVTAIGFTGTESVALGAADVNRGSEGIGVKSSGNNGFALDNEVDYRFAGTGASAEGVSEQLVIDLNGKVAYGASMDFAKMYGGEAETGVAYFYRNGVLIATQTFSSDASSGDFAANFKVQEGGFDKIVLAATGNGNGAGSEDNSDFTLKSITFFGSETQQAIATASGTLAVDWGADGKGALELVGGEAGLRTASGSLITISSDGSNHLIGMDADGKLVFEVQLTPATGKWEFFQYQKVQTPAGDGDIDFTVKASDADGDYIGGGFSVKPVVAVALVSSTTADDDEVRFNIDANAGNNVSHTADIQDVAHDAKVEVAGMTSGYDYSWDSSSKTLTAKLAGVTVFTVTVNADNTSYSFTQYQALAHLPAAQGEADSTSLQFQLRVDGASSGPAFSVVVTDDAPVVSSALNLTLDNAPDQSMSGAAPFSVSMDATDFRWTTAATDTTSLPKLYADGQVVQYDLNSGSDSFKGYIVENGVRKDVISLSFNLQTGSYQLQTSGAMFGKESTSTNFVGTTGGNQYSVLIYGDSNNNGKVNAGELPLVEAVARTGTAGTLTKVNYSSEGLGVAGGQGNWIEASGKEQLILNFRTDASSATFSLESQGGSSATISWIAYRDGVEVGRGTNITFDAGGSNEYPLTISTSQSFDQIVFNTTSGSWRPEIKSITTIDYSSSATLNLGYVLEDADKDTATGSVAISLTGSTATEILGRDGDDLISVQSDGKTVDLQLGAYGQVVSAQTTQVSASVDQVIDSGAGNDYVESGSGNDVIYLGDSGSSLHPVTGQAPTLADINATKLMALDVGNLLNSSDTLRTSALETSSNSSSSVTQWADVAHGGAGNDKIYGEAGSDLIYGGSGNDKLYGGAGNDGLRGGLGDDLLVGGQGNDVLRGDDGIDTFRWQLGDQGTVANPAQDVIKDFQLKTPSFSGDVLDLQDLLQGENSSNLGNYLHFIADPANSNNTVVQINSSGTGSGYDQTITLQNVQLSALGSGDADIINKLLSNGNLKTDL
ncbi:type I secretion C-terminal target domain-containing protein, partial [Vogesella amnigena]